MTEDVEGDVFDPIEDAIEEIKRGRMVIVVDDADRENEGDLILAAATVTPEAIAFMVRHTSGVICMPVVGERLDELRIPLMVSDVTDPQRTAFTVSVDARLGTTIAFFYGNFLRGVRRVVIDGIEPADRPGESIQFDLFEYIYHQVLRKDADWVARDLFRQKFRENEAEVARHIYDPRQIGCLLLVMSPEVMLDDLIARPLGEGDVLANANGRYRFGPGTIALDAQVETGEIGHRVGGGITTRRTFQGGRYDTMVSASAYDWDDALRPSRSATSFSYGLGAGLRPGPEFISRGRLGFEWEQTMNRLVGQRFRMLVTLDLTVLK